MPTQISKAASSVAAAREAGLRHVHSRRPGLRRRAVGMLIRRGKPVADFVIEGPGGRVVSDPATLDRIRKLAIPPAWKRVWICPDAIGHLQATGRDARGRKQYRYHPLWHEKRHDVKFSRMIEFGRALPALRRRIATDLRARGLPRRKVLATAVELLQTTLIRVGNEEYARSNNSFGLTTLKDRHVDVHRSEVRFTFRGKSGVHHRVSLRDPSIARIIRRCRDLPGQELFQYLDDRGDVAAIDSAGVNDYIREIAGHDFTAKDFRTWAGTVLAAQTMREMAAATTRREAERGAGTTRRARRAHRPTKAEVARAIRLVAARLGNTPAVCRKSYVHPQVISSYLDGTLVAAFKEVSDGGSRGPTGLRPDEAALLTLLQRRGGESAEEGSASRLEKQLQRSLGAPKAIRPDRRRRIPAEPMRRAA